MDTLTIRQAAQADLEDLARLFDAHRQLQGKEANVAAARDFLQARFENGESIVFLALDGDAAIGFAQLYPTFSSTALARVFILNDLFVAEAGRRRGVATRLLETVEAHAFERGAVRVTLNVARNNPVAQALYDARGWRRDAEYFMYHRWSPSSGV